MRAMHVALVLMFAASSSPAWAEPQSCSAGLGATTAGMPTTMPDVPALDPSQIPAGLGTTLAKYGSRMAGGHVIVGPDWITRPTPQMMARYYPVGALRLRTEGRAAITCLVTASGRLTGCGIFSEYPVGYGFGEAALMMADTFEMRPMSVDGVPVDGGHITIPISFRIPPKNWAQRLGILK